jgi:hypothetical protein
LIFIEFRKEDLLKEKEAERVKCESQLKLLKEERVKLQEKSLVWPRMHQSSNADP